MPFGIEHSLLSKFSPEFLRRYPEFEIFLELNSQLFDLVAEGVDILIRMGSLPDSRLVARRLATIQFMLCARASYREREGAPSSLGGLAGHATLAMLGLDRKPRNWTLTRNGGEPVKVEIQPRP